MTGIILMTVFVRIMKTLLDALIAQLVTIKLLLVALMVL
jgi:hypothetical protein